LAVFLNCSVTLVPATDATRLVGVPGRSPHAAPALSKEARNIAAPVANAVADFLIMYGIPCQPALRPSFFTGCSGASCLRRDAIQLRLNMVVHRKFRTLDRKHRKTT